MRVHPAQLDRGIFSRHAELSHPANRPNLAKLLESRKFILTICCVFLLVVIGTTFGRGTKVETNKIDHTNIEPSNLDPKIRDIIAADSREPLAVVLQTDAQTVFLFSAPVSRNSASSDQTSLNLDLTLTDKAFLKEAAKLGAVHFIPLAEASELPLLKTRNIIELKQTLAEGLASASAHGSLMASLGQSIIVSRIFIPGRSEIYGITDSGEVVLVRADGTITPREAGS
jgi:hypothetical protein